ncbi:hypothetical protein Gorai_021236 [Gossypium raimondii]|uniref:RNase H type-1 domain-containing protein n=1 Tax=Gossypium raimondii TaxID=29730 RepID=A0A7J8NPR9_GOSRA|nr:hypothetical protein [Gossypium raimondii]
MQILYCKRIAIGQLCPRYQLEVESTTHASCDCYFAKQVWGKLGFQWPEVVANVGFLDWLCWIFEHSTTDNKEIAAITVWALCYGSEYRGTEICVETPSSYCGSPLVPSLPLWVKINVDTGYYGLRNKMSSGFIVQDDIGQILGSGYRIYI